MSILSIQGELRLEDVYQVAVENQPVALSEINRQQMERSRAMVEDLIQKKEPVYGITTGFGRFSQVFIDEEKVEELQKNLIHSHCIGVGEPFAEDVVRAMMLLRANALSLGHSGIRPEVVDLLLNMLNCSIHPCVPSKGSVGASGDLVPLSYMALSMMGEGEALYRGKKTPSLWALKREGLNPIALKAKEGLALINGTQAMGALGVLTLIRGEKLADLADIAAALTFTALEGLTAAFHPLIHSLRPHPGQVLVAERMNRLLQSTKVMTTKREVQDPYTLRCIPQIHGASRDALSHVRGILEREINAVTDNPLFFPEEELVLSGGNFHGQPLALGMDYLGIALAELASVSERRIERLVNPSLSNLPPFLTREGGLNSGLMIAQYTAAALVSENKVLATPASVDSIPTSGNKEDHVSMGSIAARKAAVISEHVEKVLAIELLCGAQALDLKEGVELHPPLSTIHECIREHIPHLTKDRVLHHDLEKMVEIMYTLLDLDEFLCDFDEKKLVPLEGKDEALQNKR